MTTVHTLASGSSGNALLFSSEDTYILLDAGISCRRITAALKELGISLEDLTGILITHTHTDHIAGLKTLIKRYDAPIYATSRTARGLSIRVPDIDPLLEEIELCTPFPVGCCMVTAFPTSHDAPGSCGFRIDAEDGSMGLLTDTGYVTDEAAEILPGTDLMVLEANHDVEALCSGPYPYSLKQRVLGPEGHLSNEDSGAFAVTLAESGTSEIILAHLSQENNTPAMAKNAVEQALSAAGFAPLLSVAPRDHLSSAHVIARRVLCRK